MLMLPAGFVTVTGVRTEGALGLIRSHAAATASDHCAAASALKIRNVDRETRWRWRLKVLWTAACMLRNVEPGTAAATAPSASPRWARPPSPACAWLAFRRSEPPRSRDPEGLLPVGSLPLNRLPKRMNWTTFAGCASRLLLAVGRCCRESKPCSMESTLILRDTRAAAALANFAIAMSCFHRGRAQSGLRFVEVGVRIEQSKWSLADLWHIVDFDSR